MRLLCCLLCLTACSAPGLTVERAPNDIVRTRGIPGPYGAASTRLRIPTEVTASTTVAVHVPADAAGAPIPGPHPAVVFVHGGLVDPIRYSWWANHVASRGYVVVLPEHPGGLAIFTQGTATEALTAVRRASERPGPLEGLVDPDAPAAVAGHSLGGVVATRTWIDAPEDFATVAIIASFPAPWDDVSERAGSPALSIIGSTDGSADFDNVEDGFLELADPRLFAVVDGLNHYDWADDVSDDELARDGPRERPVARARQDAMRVMDTWLDAWMTDDPEARTSWAREDFPGVRESR